MSKRASISWSPDKILFLAGENKIRKKIEEKNRFFFKSGILHCRK